MEPGFIAMRVKELRKEIAELARYHEGYASLRGIRGLDVMQKRLQENRIERLGEIKRELANYVKSPQSTIIAA
jgi:hypothetical protein